MAQIANFGTLILDSTDFDIQQGLTHFHIRVWAKKMADEFWEGEIGLDSNLKEIPTQLQRFHRLCEISFDRKVRIELVSKDHKTYLVHFPIRGRVSAPEKVFRGIARRLRH